MVEEIFCKKGLKDSVESGTFVCLSDGLARNYIVFRDEVLSIQKA